MDINESISFFEQVRTMAEYIIRLFTPLPKDTGELPDFSFNKLASHPFRPERSTGWFASLVVPPGVHAVCYGSNGQASILGPGIHRGQAIHTLQYVDASRQRCELPSIEGSSLDGWKVCVQVVLFYEVADPIQVAREREPLKMLYEVGVASVLSQIETMPHEILLGSIDTPRHNGSGKADRRGLDVLEIGLLERLQTKTTLAGLQVLGTAVVQRSGDERLVEILQKEAMERVQANQGQQTTEARSRLEMLQLQMQVETARVEREASVIQAETEAQLNELSQLVRIQQARGEAEMQEISQAQEAREAERKRIAEEWRTAKELELRSMEFQHTETLAIIEGTSQVTAEAARSGMLNGLQGSSGRIGIENRDGGADVVASGIQVLGGFRDKITPPTTHFLPKPGGETTDAQARIRAESLRLERLRHVKHEVVVISGGISGGRVWFNDNAIPALQDVEIFFTCPPGYPVAQPEVRLNGSQGSEENYPVAAWDPTLYLADLVSEIMMDLVS
jgi:hypothetical protein